jgi:NADP-dependent 3-hydroxy acid dehydrogenase YdfG
MSDGKIAVVTGASSGIGAATAQALARAGFQLWLGARRLDRLREVAGPIGATALPLDVTDAQSVAAFVLQLPPVLHLLVNNAGGALGLDRIEDAGDDTWRTMWETNVLGTMRMTRALLPALRESGDGHIVNIGSIAGFETYVGGAGSASRSASPTSRRVWWRPSFPWSVSPATPSGPTRSTGASSP